MEESEETSVKRPKVADFFAGSGLATEGLRLDFDVVWANDIDAKKAATYIANHGEFHFTHAPIETFSAHDVPVHDLSWASFPCQDLSLAGKKKGIKADRSGTVWHWLRILEGISTRPKMVVAENVQGLISGNGGENYVALHHALMDLGYTCGVILLNAQHWVPQSRPRVFVIGVRDVVGVQNYLSDSPTWVHSKDIVNVSEKVENFCFWKLPKPRLKVKALSDIIDYDVPCDDDVVVSRNLALISEKHWKKVEVARAEGARVFAGYKRTRHGKQCLELRTDGIAGCLRTPAGGSSRQHLLIETNSGYKTRLLSIREAAQLMGVGSNYKFPGTYNDGYKALGDAVVVPVVRHLAKNLLSPILRETD